MQTLKEIKDEVRQIEDSILALEMDNEKVFDAIVEMHLPIVSSVAQKVFNSSEERVHFEDVYNAGILGLINAIEDFDIEEEKEFSEFCKFRIEEAAKDSVRLSAWMSEQQVK